ncbi:hypothetical protein FACS189434_05590 [Bacteroidia bacterium]|nr:hypothetical protein FACS189434_05590 [Bacteroidia bacterium]
MVIYSDTARQDLEDILYGLFVWRQGTLTFDHVKQYVFDIQRMCDKLDTKEYHTNTIYRTHQKYGEKVYPYKRNKNTTWYIIYNIDEVTGNIYVNKIMNNYLTIK